MVYFYCSKNATILNRTSSFCATQLASSFPFYSNKERNCCTQYSFHLRNVFIFIRMTMRVAPVPRVEVCLIAPRLWPSPAASSRLPPATPTCHQVSNSLRASKIDQHTVTQRSGEIHTTSLVEAIYFVTNPWSY